MPTIKEQRRAHRLAVDIPTLVESIGQPAVTLHPNLARVYERVAPSADLVGRKLPGTVRDLSTNGAFVAGHPLPLLSRIAFTFALEGFGQVEVLGWTLWRRDDDCEVPRDGGAALTLPRGFGVLFEAIALDARIAIHELVQHDLQR